MKATNFNSNFYQANKSYNREFAENVLIQKGYSNFDFTGCSYSNGASFYFVLEDGRKVRVSDHNLTGKRAFEYIQVRLVEPVYFKPAQCPKKLAKAEKERAEFKALLEAMIASKKKA